MENINFESSKQYKKEKIIFHNQTGLDIYCTFEYVKKALKLFNEEKHDIGKFDDYIFNDGIRAQVHQQKVCQTVYLYGTLNEEEK